ncbi:sulfur carrier protein ThiS [Photobacterium sp. WH77]|uniref:Sulfur carrier protein ThiS n=2 Tax=Photobacterium TaxID=657 RepID=A0A7X5AUF9_9GAMM|nr:MULTISPECIES: sulfur carrier protein ThiS [Photobacterium]MBD8514776.1 sulfur carrier protein ThiS [Photobacterium arenosum]MCG2838286.1 sulfur carrier protein ThiS [Photobacterium sp. WH77]MCG2845903.1 sulfur carrier protein ThiS [Photobacterium sp. WH80]NAW66376.1 sulfur carrier protein ThiS [Photobacterium halotolerans]NAW87311.1 sulfur carrier protein ThiS [Photobacterium halotolerans]
MTTITVLVNDKAMQLAAQSSLQQLLEQLAMPLDATAVALNQAILGREFWADQRLNDGDEIALFQAIAGG